MSASVAAADPFDLPDWLGEVAVCWRAEGSLGEHLVPGAVSGGEGRDLACDILAGDLAYPRAVLAERWRHDCHQAWTLGEVLLLTCGERLTLVVPGREVGTEVVLEAVRRLARAVGAPASRFTVALRL